MSFEVNPVLAGKFDAPDYAAANNAATTASTDDVSGADSRRYTQFDRTAIDGAGSTTDFSFGDLVDMFNPLEHIPVVSSVYRAITGETINPVSRVAGDILYGGLIGAGSAVLGGVGAVADSGLVAQTGKDSGSLVISALFGPNETKNSVQLASAGTAAPASSASQKIEIAQAAVATPSLAAALQVPTDAPAPSAAATATLPVNTHIADTPSPLAAASAPMAATSPETGTTADPATPSGTIPLLASTGGATAKQPFGGIMPPPHQPNTQEQDMTMALAQGAPSMRMGHTIYTNRLMNGPHPLPPMLSSGSGSMAKTSNAGTPAPAYAPPPVLPATFTSSSIANPANVPFTGFASGGMSAGPANQMSPALMQDMMLKAIGQYRSIAAGPSNAGGAVNLTN